MVHLLTDRRCLAHDPGPEHPESPARFQPMLERLPLLARLPGVIVAEGLTPVDPVVIERVHDRAWVDAMLALRGVGGLVDEETVLSPGSIDAALLAAGGALRLGAGLASGTFSRAFALVRPPGHHATRARGMGYCVFNNVALAATEARAAGRVAIVDWDAHYGNGTADIFAEDPDILPLSLHESALYPAVDDVGPDSPRNIVLPPGIGDAEYLALFSARVLPLVREFDPAVILVSCGFDAHVGDPLSNLGLSTATYGELTRRLLALGRPVGMVLEGGYDVGAVADCLEAVVRALAE